MIRWHAVSLCSRNGILTCSPRRVCGNLLESACGGNAYRSCYTTVIVAYRRLKIACSSAVFLGKIVATGSDSRRLDQLPLACIIDGASAIDRGTIHGVGPLNGSIARRNSGIVGTKSQAWSLGRGVFILRRRSYDKVGHRCVTDVDDILVLGYQVI